MTRPANQYDIGAFINENGSILTRITSTSDETGASVDVTDYDSVVLFVGIEGDDSNDSVQFDLQESSDDGASDAFENTDDSVTVSGSGRNFGSTDIDVSGNEQYLRVRADSSNQSLNGTDIILFGAIITGGAKEPPV